MREFGEHLWNEILALLDHPVAALGPVGDDEMLRIEEGLGVRIPQPLRSILSLTGGVCDDPDFGPRMCWPVANLMQDNANFRANTSLPNASSFLCFGDNTAGSLFLMSTDEGSEAVYVWHPIDDEIVRIADGFKQFMVGWINGELES